MNTLKCEVLVVGAGPAGGMAAKSCAEKGIDTILIEKKPEIGAPLRCAEVQAMRPVNLPFVDF